MSRPNFGPQVRTRLPEWLPQPVDWARWHSRFVFFTGKGGVGKTTIACAVAAALADASQRVLLVSTDPASNLDDVLATEVGSTPAPVPGVPRLEAVNIDPTESAAAYRDRILDPYRLLVPEAEFRVMEEQLAGQCTVEIAAFDEFARLLADPDRTRGFDHVIFDTAPTGHTLRLLSLPRAWSGYIAANPEGAHGASCLGPLAGLQARREEYEATVAALTDAERTTLVLVAHAEQASLREAARAGLALAALGVANQRLIVNGVLGRPMPGDAVAEGLSRRQRDALTAMPPSLAGLPVAAIPMAATDLIGPDQLRGLVRGDDASAMITAPDPSSGSSPPIPTLPGIDALVDELAAAGHGVVLVMGKGGVGKTTIAIEVARLLARLGHCVHLSTTDPASDMATLVRGVAAKGLTVSRIEPAVEVTRYTEERLRGAQDLPADRRALLVEDLQSPCTEEIAVFSAFSRLLSEGRSRFVVVDTAPTGHTLLLLDATGAYHREVLRTTIGVHARITTPLMRLQDPEFTRVLIVTLAEATPVQEATELQDDLRRAGIEPYGWVVNATLTRSGTADPLLRRRASLEERHMRRVCDVLARRTWLFPWQVEPVIGHVGLDNRPTGPLSPSTWTGPRRR